ncbi:unnamed protein product [Clonostachys rosea f. rosea IK726]|uniref:Mpv17/PMP22 family protein n=2 Tax=Bionectria ochroleuca TaxID=29856 RepID=A0A0B7K8A7_BIOOC|nr:unnamed protein product [Clonostachys rosea f. rosea IK726]
MAPSPVKEATLQAVLLSGVANILAQYIESYKNEVEFKIDWIPFFQFILFALLSTPPNFYWQSFLESTFPAHPPAPHPKKSDEPAPPPKLSIRNTLIKLALDQSVGSVVNNMLFALYSRAIRDAMPGAPPIYSVFKAIDYWTTRGTVDFSKIDFKDVWDGAVGELWPIMLASWKLWPFVSVINFTLIKTVQGRNLVGGIAGIAWGTYMSLAVSS